MAIYPMPPYICCMKETKENIYTVPNFLSAYRILAFPFILWLIIAGQERMFVGFLTANFITDILDGLIARSFNMQTKMGARLDSLADLGTYILAFTGIFFFKPDYLAGHKIGFSVFAGLYAVTFLMTMVKFKKICGLHLYSFKLTGYLQGIFLVLLFLNLAPEWYYYTMMIIGCAANIEEGIIFILLKEPRSNVKGLYWMLKNK